MRWNFVQLARTVPRVLAHGEAGEVVRELAGRVYSERKSYLLRRDNNLEHPVPRAKTWITVRPLIEADIGPILRERPVRAAALKSELRKCCYVAVTMDEQIAYMQFLIDASQNALLSRDFRGLCPPLNQDEALLEWAYTFLKFRGKGIMGSAMAQIAENGAALGARWLYTYVAIDNVPSLKGCHNAGFEPYRLRTDHWRLGRLRQTVSELSEPGRQ